LILVDTSVWIDHLRKSEPLLVDLMESGLAVCHAFVLGELALGNLRNRTAILVALRGLKWIEGAPDDVILSFIERHNLAGTGIGYIDAHLLVATARTAGSTLWTRDKRLKALAEGLALAAADCDTDRST
jgi:predicted nucleic acid-binding protein